VDLAFSQPFPLVSHYPAFLPLLLAPYIVACVAVFR
jgi:hypothetical protein